MSSMNPCPFLNKKKDFEWVSFVFAKTDYMSLKFGKFVARETFPNYEPQYLSGTILQLSLHCTPGRIELSLSYI